MRSRALALLVALGLAALAVGCRDLVLPEPPPPPEQFVRGVVRDPRGIVMPGVELIVDNAAYVEREERREWQGLTDGQGAFQTDLPAPGLYDVYVSRSSYDWLPSLHFWGIWFEGPAIQLDYPVQEQLLEVVWQEGFPLPSDSEIELRLYHRIQRPDEASWREESIRTDLQLDGLYRAYPPEDRYQLILYEYGSGFDLRYVWPDSLSLPVDSLLTLAPPFVSASLNVTLAGSAEFLDAVRVRVESDWDHRLDCEYEVGQGPLTVWGPSGGVEMIVRPATSLPVLPCSQAVSFRQGDEFEVDLGSHRVLTRIETAAGHGLPGASVYLDDGINALSISTDADGEIAWYLRPGLFFVRVTRSGYLELRAAMTVDDDLEVSYVLTPEP